jgi:hypothetical protein
MVSASREKSYLTQVSHLTRHKYGVSTMSTNYHVMCLVIYLVKKGRPPPTMSKKRWSLIYRSDHPSHKMGAIVRLSPPTANVGCRIATSSHIDWARLFFFFFFITHCGYVFFFFYCVDDKTFDMENLLT